MVIKHCKEGRAVLKPRRVVARFARVWPEPHLEQLLLERARIGPYQPLQAPQTENCLTGF